MAPIELVTVTAEAEYDGQAYGYRLTCRAEDWDAADWMPQYYVDLAEQWLRQSVPAHVPVRTTIRRETLEGDPPVTEVREMAGDPEGYDT